LAAQRARYELSYLRAQDRSRCRRHAFRARPVQAALDTAGHRAVVAKSVAQLLAQVHADLDDLDLIVLDLRMPHASGVELVRRIRKLDQGHLRRLSDLNSRRYLNRRSLTALATTRAEAPVSANTAIHSVATPNIASARNATFNPIDSATLTRMLSSVARLRRMA